jgi:carbon monoxide dehydrogenase subunit G
VSVVQVSVEVDAPPDAVWRVVADPNNLPHWDRHISGVSDLPKDGLAPGIEYTTELRFLGARAHGTSRILELRPPEYSKVQLKGLVEGTVETWLEPLDGDRTLLRHRIQYRFIGGPIGRLAARAVNVLGATATLKRGVEAQKHQAEQEYRKA